MSDTLILCSSLAVFLLSIAALVAVIQTASNTRQVIDWLKILHRELELQRKQ